MLTTACPPRGCWVCYAKRRIGEHTLLRSIPTRNRTVPAVDRAARLLDVLCRNGRDWGLTEIAQEVGIHKGTARDILLTLQQHGLVDRVGATGRFRLGSGAARLAQAAFSRLDVRDAARSSMLRLRDETGETVLLGVREEQHVMIAEVMAPARELHVSARVGQRLPLCAGSFGKVFLAEPGAFEEYLEAGGTLRAFTPSTQTDADVYAAELLVARAKGYALDDEEYLNGVRAASAIIRGPVGVALGAVTVVGFTARVSLRALEEIGEACREAAEESSRRVGRRSSVDQA
ncbi:MAG: helix-turn-helix domain-containing protein [Chloroflexi bacterium]|nr:helix-turn-helix domain-containing protein [Chloroflexota bacterium]